MRSAPRSPFSAVLLLGLAVCVTACGSEARGSASDAESDCLFYVRKHLAEPSSATVTVTSRTWDDGTESGRHPEWVIKGEHDGVTMGSLSMGSGKYFTCRTHLDDGGTWNIDTLRFGYKPDISRLD